MDWDFLGHTKCSDCKKAPGVIKCKDCPSRWMLKCPECVVASHAMFPLHRVEVSQITWWAYITHMTLLISGGMGNFLTRTLSKTSDFAIKLVTLRGLVLALLLVQRISSSLMSWALIPSRSSAVTVVPNLYPTGPNSCVNDGFQLLFYVHKLSSPLIPLKPFTKSCYKGRQACMITIIHYYNNLIMPTFIPQLWVVYCFPSFHFFGKLNLGLDQNCNKDMGFYPSSILFTFHYLAFVSHDSFPYLSVGSHVTIYLSPLRWCSMLPLHLWSGYKVCIVW